MLTQIPAWPKALPRKFFPIAQLGRPTQLSGPLSRMAARERLALQRAGRCRDQDQLLRCSGLTGTWTEALYTNTADYTALASFTTEASLLAGTNRQPVFPALFFDQGGRAQGRAVGLFGQGVLSSSSTPTYTFTFRFGTTSGSSYLSGTAVGVSAAITTASSITNKWWSFRLDLICTTVGIGTGNTTLSGAGFVASPGGFASPFVYAVEPTTPDTATWTSTIDNSATQYFNASVTCSASNASNTIQLKQLICAGLN